MRVEHRTDKSGISRMIARGSFNGNDKRREWVTTNLNALEVQEIQAHAEQQLREWERENGCDTLLGRFYRSGRFRYIRLETESGRSPRFRVRYGQRNKSARLCDFDIHRNAFQTLFNLLMIWHEVDPNTLEARLLSHIWFSQFEPELKNI